VAITPFPHLGGVSVSSFYRPIPFIYSALTSKSEKKKKKEKEKRKNMARFTQRLGNQAFPIKE
jgi:hypothetical protein